MNNSSESNSSRFYQDIIEFAGQLNHIGDYEYILNSITNKAIELFDCEFSSIIMVNPATLETIKTIASEARSEIDHGKHIIQQNVVGYTIKSGEAFFTADIKKDNRFKQEFFAESSIKSVLCQPIYFENKDIGYILLMRTQIKESFAEDDLQQLKRFSDVASPWLGKYQQIKSFFQKPPDQSELLEKYKTVGLIGQSPAFINMLQAIEAVAKSDVRVLLEGYSGTGKELISRAIHSFSNRSDQPFVTIDCGAIPQQVMESELFGHTKGAFTGAHADRKGLFQEADGGTLFLDEIGNLNSEMQVKLLRVLQESEIRPVGSNRNLSVDVRIIAASSPRLKDLVEEGKYRSELYYRLNVFPIQIPDLSARRSDIPLIANHFIHKFAEKQGKKVCEMHPKLERHLINHPWPGNIRQLENLIEQIITYVPEDCDLIHLSQLPPELQSELEMEASAMDITEKKSLADSLSDFERKLIISALENNDWNQSKAARELMTSETTIRYKMEKYGIKRGKK